MPRGGVSFDATVGGAEDGELGTSLHDVSVDIGPNQEDQLCEDDAADKYRAALPLALDGLNDREREIFGARRLTQDPPTLDELAAKFGISREWVRQIEQVAAEWRRRRLGLWRNLQRAFVTERKSRPHRRVR